MAQDAQIVDTGAGDPALVEEILQAIARFCEKNGVAPCPVELRDTMLAVAALTHIEAAKLNCSEIETSAEGFAEAAADRFRDVTGVLSMPLFCSRPHARTLN
jgi:hypothetical protein